MISSQPALTDEQKARIAANRARALERQAQKNAGDATGSNGTTAAAVPSHQPPSSTLVVASRPFPPPSVQQPLPTRTASMTEPSQQPIPLQPVPIKTNSAPLTAEQEATRQKNREAALARQAAHATQTTVVAPSISSHSSVSTSSAAAIRQVIAPVVAAPTSPLAPVFTYRSSVVCEIVVLNTERFKITITPYNKAVSENLKNVTSRIWDFDLKMNTCKYADLNMVYKILSEIKELEVKVVRLPDMVARILTKPDSGKRETNPNNPSGDLASGVDEILWKTMFPYQKEGMRFGVSKGGRVMIADEMGLGKSIQALAIARYYRHDFPLVIVCPASVKSAWKHQFEWFCPAIKDNLFIMEKEKEPLPSVSTSNTVIIMSYDLMARKQDELVKANYGVYIFDESHYLKDSKAKRTKSATLVSKKAKRVILLSGTPALSRPSELFSQLRLIDSSLFTNYKEFAIRYCDGKGTNYGFQAKGVTNSEELSIILQRKLMIRRHKSEVLKDLPPKLKEIIYIKSDDISTRMDKSRLTSARAFDKGSAFDPGNENLMEYFVHTGTAKAIPVCDHIIDNYFYDGATDDTRKILVFAHHQIVLDTIEHALSKRNITSIRIDGQTPSSKRGDLCTKFQEDPSVRVAVLSITAAGQGITLTAASVVIFAELYWIPGNMHQAEDRAHRVGQHNPVVVQYMLAKETADDIIWPLIKSKIEMLSKVNLNSENYTNADTKEIDTDNMNWDIEDGDDGNVKPTASKKRKM